VLEVCLAMLAGSFAPLQPVAAKLAATMTANAHGRLPPLQVLVVLMPP